MYRRADTSTLIHFHSALFPGQLFIQNEAFSVSAPRIWNTLPLSIRSSPTLGVFQSALKTNLFSLAFDNVFLLCMLTVGFYFIIFH